MNIKASILVIVFTFISKHSFSQEDSIYFPQEKIIIDECANDINKNECLNNRIEKEINLVLAKVVTKLDKKMDTLKTRVSFQLNDINQINDESVYSRINDKKLNKKFYKAVNKQIANIHVLKVENMKPINYRPKYYFYYNYIPNNNQLTKIPTDSSKVFNGGVIEQVPLFPKQVRIDGETDRKKFNDLMQMHIGHHFNYPKYAISQKISGKVSVLFHINKDGYVSNIRTKGPSPILENEVIRIISLLPKFQPGLLNGNPHTYPYSIPISFKLKQ